MTKKAILISINSDIGYFFADKLLKDNFKLIGTYRTYSKRLSDLKKRGVILKRIDFSKKLSDKIIQNLIKECRNWDLLLNFTGNQNPIGKILTLKKTEIISSFNINFLAQFIITKEMLKFKKRNSFVLFFAGGGVNNATKNYSTYTLSKIALIKLVELLDFEIKNTRFSIIGPGWVNTKIHNTTLVSNKAGKNKKLTIDKLKSNNLTSMAEIFDFFKWLYSQKKSIISGRNFSVVYDKNLSNLKKKIAKDQSFFKLRRKGN